MGERACYEFGPFMFIPSGWTLYRVGEKVRLSPRAAEVLAVLIENKGQYVSNETLLRKVWGACNEVGANNVSIHISSIRKALGDSPDKPVYIEGASRAGYRFIADVREISEEEVRRRLQSFGQLRAPASGQPQTPPVTKGENDKTPEPSPALGLAGTAHSWLRTTLGATAAVSVVVLGLGWYLLRQPPTPANAELRAYGPGMSPEFQLRELTTNSYAMPLTTATVSPDGKYVAYLDQDGICVQLVESGETHRLLVPGGAQALYLSWFPESTKLLVSTERSATEASAIWEVPIFPEQARLLEQDGGGAVVSPDGSEIAFTRDNGQEIWVSQPDGGNARRVSRGNYESTYRNLVWAPLGGRLLAGRIDVHGYWTDVSIELLNVNNGHATVILKKAGLRAFCASPDGRIIYAEADPPPIQNTVNLWAIPVDYETGKTKSAPRRITNWPSACIYCLSLTYNGKCLVFIKGPYHSSVYVGDLIDGGKRVESVRQLTLDDADNLPTAWTNDSKYVLFHSNRTGKFQILMQALSEASASVIASDEEDDKGARVTPDGKSILYFARPRYKIFSSAAPTRLMMKSLSGGPSRTIFSERGVYSVRCSRGQGALCVESERGIWSKRIAFYALDPSRGKGRKLAETHIALPLDRTNWDVSPDGSRIAVVVGGEPDGDIRILSLADGGCHDLMVKGRSGFQSMDWSADGKGIYISSQTTSGADILFVDMEGHATVVRQQIGSYYTWAVPSPDGKYVALLEWAAAGKIWMMKGF